MNAPLSVIISTLREKQAEPSQVEIDAGTMLQELGNVYASVGYVANSISAKCRRHGLTAMLAVLTPETATAVTTALGMLGQVWPQFSDEPFPEMSETAAAAAAPEGDAQ